MAAHVKYDGIFEIQTGRRGDHSVLCVYCRGNLNHTTDSVHMSQSLA